MQDMHWSCMTLMRRPQVMQEPRRSEQSGSWQVKIERSGPVGVVRWRVG
jgi:hypothetical protein